MLSFPAFVALAALQKRKAVMKKGKRNVYHEPFVALSKEMILKCTEWRELTPQARDIYVLLKAKYNGKNNGQIRLYYSEMRQFAGLKQNKTISRHFKELEGRGWIRRTKLGGMFRYLNEYALTGKYDKLLRD